MNPGATITDIRAMRPDECEALDWDLTYDGPVVVIEFDDGSFLFPSRDPEGNGPGCFFGNMPNGDTVSLHVPK